jgi:hypothetical protein
MVNNMLPCFVFNRLSFEIFDPAFAANPCPVGPTFLTPFFSHSSKLPLPQLLSFDNHLNCLGGGVPIHPASLPSAPLLCAIAALFCRARQLISHLFNRLRTLYKNTRVYPSSSQFGNHAPADPSGSQPPSSLCYNLQFISTQENS